MSAHTAYVHYAPMLGKCHLHIPPRYSARMDTPANRLKNARAAAGFGSAREAALAMDIPYETYAQHENGGRGFRADRAAVYARRFRTSPEWLLYGKGDAPAAASEPTEDELAEMVRLVIEDVVTVQTRISDLPRIVAPGLRRQLERFRSGDVLRGGPSTAPDIAAQSPAPTKRSAPAKSRTT